MIEIQYCPDPGLGQVRVAGTDARQFLHAQTTQRIDDQPAGERRLAAWLNAKGRVRALFDVVPDGDEFRLILPQSEVETLLRGFGLFVLRARVTLEAVPEQAVASLLGPVDDWLARQGFASGQQAVTAAGAGLVIRAGRDRIDLTGPPDWLAELSAGLPRGDRDDFERTAVRDGLPTVSGTLRERYIPQMLNLERLGAVSFSKGCYPGQEIVARTENLGTVKRRLRQFRLGPGTRPAAGDAVVDAAGDSAGEINRIAPTDDGYALLAVVAIDADGLALGSDGRQLAPGAGPD